MQTVNTVLNAILEDGSWDIEYASEYASGHDAPKRGILFADWNDETRRGTDEERRRHEYWPVVSRFRSRFADILERAGFACEWSDEWTICECGKAVRTQPDGWDWRPQFVVKDGRIECHECWRDCMSIGDRMEYCVENGWSIFAARRDAIPS